MQSVKLKILDKRLGDSIPLPELATSGSAGVDSYSVYIAPVFDRRQFLGRSMMVTH